MFISLFPPSEQFRPFAEIKVGLYAHALKS